MSPINLKDKLHLYNALSTAVYASVLGSPPQQLEVIHQRCLNSISYIKHVTNTEVFRQVNSNHIQDVVAESRMWFAGHIMWMLDHCPAKLAMKWQTALGQRKRARSEARSQQYKQGMGRTWTNCSQQRWYLPPYAHISMGGSKIKTKR